MKLVIGIKPGVRLEFPLVTYCYLGESYFGVFISGRENSSLAVSFSFEEEVLIFALGDWYAL